MHPSIPSTHFYNLSAFAEAAEEGGETGAEGGADPDPDSDPEPGVELAGAVHLVHGRVAELQRLQAAAGLDAVLCLVQVLNLKILNLFH